MQAGARLPLLANVLLCASVIDDVVPESTTRNNEVTPYGVNHILYLSVLTNIDYGTGPTSASTSTMTGFRTVWVPDVIALLRILRKSHKMYVLMYR